MEPPQTTTCTNRTIQIPQSSSTPNRRRRRRFHQTTIVPNQKSIFHSSRRSPFLTTLVLSVLLFSSSPPPVPPQPSSSSSSSTTEHNRYGYWSFVRGTYAAPTATSTSTSTSTAATNRTKAVPQPPVSRSKNHHHHHNNHPNHPNHSQSRQRSQQQLHYHNHNHNKQKQKHKRNTNFLKWCQTVLGIQTLLYIQDFEHIDHLKERSSGSSSGMHRYHYDDETPPSVVSSSSSSSSSSSRDEDVGTTQSSSTIRDTTTTTEHHNHEPPPTSSSSSSPNNGDNEEESNHHNHNHNNREVSTLLLRGLAASRNIHSGEIILSIPFHALLTVTTAIDHHPVLSSVLGPEARKQHGWTLVSSSGRRTSRGVSEEERAEEEEEQKEEEIVIDDGTVSPIYETPLLVIAILYHRSLGSLSPISPYIEILTSTPIDHIPFLWTTEELQRAETEGRITKGVRERSEGIIMELREVYEDVVGVLVLEHGNIFGDPVGRQRRRGERMGKGENGGSGSSGGVGVAVGEDGGVGGSMDGIVDRNDGTSNNYEDDFDDYDDDDYAFAGGEKEEVWTYSFEQFRWAFAVVNSRRWHLPLIDPDTDASVTGHTHNHYNDSPSNIQSRRHGGGGGRGEAPPSSSSSLPSSTVGTTIPKATAPVKNRNKVTTEDPPDPEIPPATQPTDSFVSQQTELLKTEQDEVSASSSTSTSTATTSSSSASSSSSSGERRRRRDEEPSTTASTTTIDTTTLNHDIPKQSFLPPLADLLNFGPPCTHGRYNPTTHAFEVVATCPFLANQEVTFWYSDDCDDAMVTNYGFTHPMVPSCRTLEDWRDRSDSWRRYAKELEGELREVYRELDRMNNVCRDCLEGRKNHKKEGDGKGMEYVGDEDIVMHGSENGGQGVMVEGGVEIGNIRKMRQRYAEDLGL